MFLDFLRPPNSNPSVPQVGLMMAYEFDTANVTLTPDSGGPGGLTNRVTGVTDLSGHGKSLSQSTLANAPWHDPAKSVVKFVKAASQVLVEATQAFTDCTVIMVLNPLTTVTANHTWFEVPTVKEYVAGQGSTGMIQQFDGAAWSPNGLTITPATKQVIAVNFSSSYSYMRHNTDTKIYNKIASTSGTGFNLGRIPSASDNEIYGVYIYSGSISEYNYNNLIRYINWKFSMSVPLSVNDSNPDYSGSKVYLLCTMGQSNASGAVPINTLPIGDNNIMAEYSQVKMWYVSEFQDLKVGANHQSYTNLLALYGTEGSFARKVKSQLFTNEVYLAKWSKGGTSIAVDWNKIANNLYPLAVNNVNAAITALHNLGKTVQVVIYWDQGESDAPTLAYANNYQAALTLLISNFRADIASDYSIPVIIRLMRNDIDPAYTYISTVRAAEDAIVAGAVSNCYGINSQTNPTYGLLADQLHLNGPAQIGIGETELYNRFITFIT